MRLLDVDLPGGTIKPMQFFEFATVIAAASTSALIAIYWLMRGLPASEPKGTTLHRDTSSDVSFLFEEENLHHASDKGSALYQLVPGRDDWASLRERLLNRFPNLPENPDTAVAGVTTLPARDIEDGATLCLKRDGAFTRISMLENNAQSPAQFQRLKTMQSELEDLRRASDTTPHAIWQVNSEGEVTWYNAAYETLYQKLHSTPPQNDRPVFEIDAEFDSETNHRRVSTRLPNDSHKDWYDVSAISVGDITIYHAVDINAVVKSEIAQRNFVQTLAKTFAQLSIGLAIFDRNGQLALFNPALIDLTGLPAEFLSGRPTLMSFFDRIRENRRMPEPKNYASWRQEITEVIAAATDGTYQETWALETGQTFRVRGRPHPDGAIAFLIEDISAEISLTRNFRAELELGQSLMDTFDEALVVFSSTGILTFCNLAYRQMWGLDPDNSFADVTIADSVQEWARQCEPGARWAALSDFVLDYGETEAWEMATTLTNGQGLSCTVSRIASGATIVRFSRVSEPEQKPRRLVQAPEV